MILPRASRHPDPKFSPEPPKSPEYPRFNRYPDPEPPKFREPPKQETRQEPRPKYDRYDSNERSSENWRNDKEYYQKYQEDSKFNKYENERPRIERYDSGFKEQKHVRNGSKGYRDDFEEEVEYRDKKKEEIVPRPRSKYIPEERYYQEEKRKFTDEYYQNESKPRYFEGEREKIRTRYPPNDPRFYSEYEDKRIEKDYYRNSKYHPEERYYPENKTLEKPQKKFNPEDPRFYSDTRQSEKSNRSKYSQEETPRPKYPQEEPPRSKYSQEEPSRSKYSQEETPRSKYPQEEPPRSKYQDDFFDDHSEPRRRAEDRQRSPSPPEENASPKDRFKDAKEKFLLLERERLEDERNRRAELHHSTPNMKDKTFLKRHESMIIPKERYHEDRRYEIDPRYQPKPAPRTMVPEEEIRYRREPPINRYRNQEDRFEPRDRRSMFNQIEEEHKKNSNEIARELKRRSYMEPEYHKEKYDAPDNRRYPGLDREPYNFSKSNAELDKVAEKYNHKYEQKAHQKFKQPAGYRHSYAEPKLSMERVLKKHHPEMVHRTNSTVSNSGRVGIASVNPY